MRRVVAVLVVGLCASVADLSAQTGPNGANGRAHSRTHIKTMHAAKDTESVAPEISIVGDTAGRQRVILRQDGVKGRVPDLFWIVDTKKEEYVALKLTGNDGNDAKRIARAYRNRGVDASEPSIAQGLQQSREQRRVKIDEINQRRPSLITPASAPRRGMPAVRRTLATIAAALRPIPALSSLAQLSRSVQSTPPLLSGDCPPSASRGQTHTLTPTARPQTGVIRRAQFGQYCTGTGYATIQTWEPGAYFGFLYLNETSSWLWYSRYSGATNPAYVSADGDSSCWANPETFAYTHWYVIGCGNQKTRLSTYFGITGTGDYINFDFPMYLGCTSNCYVRTTNTASVWVSSDGAGCCDFTHDRDAGDAYSWAGAALLSFQTSGSASDDSCNWICDPDPYDVEQCENPDWGTYWDYNGCYCASTGSPILIDVEGDGFALTDPFDGVAFDLMATGRPVQTAWTRADSDDAFLALDRNHNGVIDDGSELFGDSTAQAVRKSNKPKFKNGFLALSAYDEPSQGGNNDGLITADDAVYAELRLWKDSNQNGVSEPNELTSLADAGVRAISVRYVKRHIVDEFGNNLRYWGHVVTDGDLDRKSGGRRAVDVFFKVVPLGTVRPPASSPGQLTASLH